MSALAAGAPSVVALLRLGRVSNLPTVWTNVVAAIAIAGGALRPFHIVLIGSAMTAFYVGGMYLNDFFDREIDERERRGRPIEAGEISAGAVRTIGFGLLAVGIVLLVPFGLPALLCGLLLGGQIVLYDLWHKRNPFSPLMMGLCRALVYLTAGAAVGGVSVPVTVGAFAQASHVAGLTYAAKQEALNRVDRLWPVVVLALPLLIALPAIASGWEIAVSFGLLVAADVVAVRLVVERPAPDAVPRAVSGLIAAICLVDALMVTLAGGGVLVAMLCAAGYPLTRLFQSSIPGT